MKNKNLKNDKKILPMKKNTRSNNENNEKKNNEELNNKNLSNEVNSIGGKISINCENHPNTIYCKCDENTLRKKNKGSEMIFCDYCGLINNKKK